MNESASLSPPRFVDEGTSNPLTIDFVVRSLHRGGAERQLVLLADGLARRGHRVRLLTFYPGGAFEEDAKNRRLEVVCLHKRDRWDVLPFTGRLLMALREGRADVVHPYMGTSNVFVTLLKPLHRRTTVWGVRASNMNLGEGGWLLRTHAWVEAQMARYADLVISNSEAGRRHAVAEGFPGRLIRVVENGFETDRWNRDAIAGRRFREMHGLPADAPVVAVVGRSDPIKGHDDFIRAAALAHAKRPDAVFCVIGSAKSTLRSSLEALGEELLGAGVLRWIEPQSEMLPAYSALDVLVSSSLGEGFPNVIAEGMACGALPVVTDVGDSRAIVGTTGIVVRAGDSDALGQGILDALDSSRRPWSSPRERITSLFSVERLVDRTEMLLRDTLKCTSSSPSR